MNDRHGFRTGAGRFTSTMQLAPIVVLTATGVHTQAPAEQKKIEEIVVTHSQINGCVVSKICAQEYGSHPASRSESGGRPAHAGARLPAIAAASASL